MAPVLHLRPADFRVMPWKDGGGTTTQVAIEPPSATLADPFLWRLSSARVERSGPFSRFPGLRRILALLDGPGMDLAFEDGSSLGLGDSAQPIAFDGGLGVQATLRGGPCVDLGVIYDPARVACALVRLEPGSNLRLQTGNGTHLVYAPKGGLEVPSHGWQIHPGEALRWEGSQSLDLQVPGPEAPVWKMQVLPQPLAAASTALR